MSLIQSLPPELEAVRDEAQLLAALKGSEGYAAFLGILDRLRSLNYQAILSAKAEDVPGLVGEARAINKVREAVDDRIGEGTQVAAQLDAAMEKLHREQAAAQRSYSPRVEPRFRPTPAIG